MHSWMWTTNRGEQWIRDNHSEWFQVSRSGKSCFDHPPYVDYYRWVSPVNPSVVEYLADKVHELASNPLVDGVHLDYVRYPDVILPKALWRKYGLDQTEEMADYDFDYSDATRKAYKDIYGEDPLEMTDPAHNQQWLHFRYDSVTKLVSSKNWEIKTGSPLPTRTTTICHLVNCVGTQLQCRKQQQTLLTAFTP